jgi:hypothetical protein
MDRLRGKFVIEIEVEIEMMGMADPVVGVIRLGTRGAGVGVERGPRDTEERDHRQKMGRLREALECLKILYCMDHTPTTSRNTLLEVQRQAMLLILSM